MGLNETLKALADPVRRDILALLRDGPKSAGDIAQRFHLAPATVSYHLSKLKKADLLTETKEKNFIFYAINTSIFEDILTWLQDLGGTHHDKENLD